MHLLNEIIIVLALSALVVFLCQKIKIPSIVGFLFTGLVAGPSGIGAITSQESVEILAEIGVVLLLFTVGMEFSLHQLFRIRRSVLMGGSVQAALTIAAGTIWAILSGFESRPALFLGILLTMSSTAIVLKLLQEKAEIDTPHGSTTLGILIFQDILIIPAMLLVPFLAGEGFSSDESVFLLVSKLLLITLGVFVAAKWLVPFILLQFARTRNRELFLLGVLVIGFSIAWASSGVGLSLALGAFLAGLIISESEYSHQALGSILPFRDIFLSFFFISVGMLLDLSAVGETWFVILLITLTLLALKTLTGATAALALGHPLRTALLTGLALSQVGEFSFLLSKSGLDHGLVSASTYQIFLSVAVLSMSLSPFLLALGPTLVRASFLAKKGKGAPPPEASASGTDDHLLIIGYGMNGRNLAKAARRYRIPHSIVEMNPDTVREERRRGAPIHFGDATNEEVVLHAGINRARVAVVAINDPAATRRIVELLRRVRPTTLCIITRTRFVSEMKPLYDLGADEVVPEEFETSIEIFSRVMRRYLVPRLEMEQLVSEIRQDGYEMLRRPNGPDTPVERLKPLLKGMDIEIVRVGEDSSLKDRTLEEAQIRTKHDVTVLAIQTVHALISNPSGKERLSVGDRLVVWGKIEQIRSFADHLLLPKS